MGNKKMKLIEEIKQALANGNTLVVNRLELQEAKRLRNNGTITFLEYLECEDKPNHYELIDLAIK